MGCVKSKQAVSVNPALDNSGDNVGSGSSPIRSGTVGSVLELEQKKRKKKKVTGSGLSGSELDDSVSFSLGNLQKYIEIELVAAGWPAWLCAVAGEAIHGWVPLKADSFQKLEKVGQGTYSSVFKAREVASGRIVALKKVRFDNFEPESVRFMAREILILRRLNHPNIIKLEGLITSRLSTSMYLVFEYMEHDLSGLLSCPDIKFSESQVKCYMKQLLSGLEHCHSRGVMHRDIKGANLLVNNDGVMKVADFGLANFCNSKQTQPLTSRVVTLWYRPPELLLGSTDYGASIDLWSVGCVFAELLVGHPILQGRTEVEQLHKIFKLCGSPPDEYWKNSKLPHATLFKPHRRYESCLWESLEELPNSAVNMIETLLSVEPNERGTASSALASEYFTTKPYACEPSSLPKYPPSKEIDAKHREEPGKKRPNGRTRGHETTRKLTKKQHSFSKPTQENSLAGAQLQYKINDHTANEEKEDIIIHVEPQRTTLVDASHIKNASHGDVPFLGPLQLSGSSGFAWAKRRLDNSSSVRSRSRSSSMSTIVLEPSGASHDTVQNQKPKASSRGYDSYEIVKQAMMKSWSQMEGPDSFDGSDGYQSQEMSRRSNLIYGDEEDKVEFSGPLLSQSHRVDELLERHERHIRQVVRRSWLQRGKKEGIKT